MASKVNKQFGAHLRALRRKKGLTQEQLAERSGLHYKFIGRVERGTDIKLSNIAKIARGLRMSIAELLSYCFPPRKLSKKAEEVQESFTSLLASVDKEGKEEDLEHIELILEALKHFKFK